MINAVNVFVITCVSLYGGAHPGLPLGPTLQNLCLRSTALLCPHLPWHGPITAQGDKFL